MAKDTLVDEILKRFCVTSYRKYLVGKEYSVNMINKKINRLNAYNIYLISISKMTDMIVSKKDKLSIATGSEKEVSVSSEAEIERILFYIEDPSKVRLRDKLIRRLFPYTRIRARELVSMRLKDVDFVTLHLTVIGKGLKMRKIPMKDNLITTVNNI